MVLTSNDVIFDEFIGNEEAYIMLCEKNELNTALMSVLNNPLVPPHMIYVIDIPEKNYKNTFLIEFTLFGFRIADESSKQMIAYNSITKNISTDYVDIDAELIRGLAALAFAHLESKIKQHIFIYEIVNSPRFNEFIHSCLVYISNSKRENSYLPKL